MSKGSGRKISSTSLLLALFLGGFAGALHLYMRFSNNTQGEMFDSSGHVDLAYCVLMFLAVFVPIFVVMAIGGFFHCIAVAVCPDADGGRQAGSVYQQMLASPDTDIQQVALPQFIASISGALGQCGGHKRSLLAT